VGTPDELVEAFSAAVPFALRELAGAEAVMRDVGPATADGTADVAASVRLTTAGGPWWMTLCLPARTAGELARRILAGATDLTPDLIGDCMGEVANVVAGQAKTLLVGSPFHFTLSTPQIGVGAVAGAAEAWTIHFDSDAGEFGVRLSRST